MYLAGFETYGEPYEHAGARARGVEVRVTYSQEMTVPDPRSGSGERVIAEARLRHSKTGAEALIRVTEERCYRRTNRRDWWVSSFFPCGKMDTKPILSPEVPFSDIVGIAVGLMPSENDIEAELLKNTASNLGA